MVVPLKLVSFNTYLIARQFNQNRITQPEQRASRMQSFLRRFDICFLQEVWGSGLAELTLPSLALEGLKEPSNNADKSFVLPESRGTFLGRWLPGSLAEIFYTFYFHAILSTGGLYDMSRPSAAECVYRAKHTFTKSRSKSRKGVEATLWTKIAAWEGGYSLLVFNTHLDPWIVENRQSQVKEIVQFMRTTLQNIEESNGENDYDWSATGVLVVGDFNVKASETKEYQDLFVSREWRDFLYENDNRDGSGLQTYALRNSLVRHPEDCGRIDYIFGVDSVNNESGNVSYKFLPLKSSRSTVIRHPDGEELSDHYPVLVELLPETEAGSSE